MIFKNQKEMFLYIWENREHVSELSGKPLLNINHNQWHWQFIHVLGKGPYPSFKLREDNILLGLPDEHANQETFEIFNEKHTELKRKYYKEIYNR